MEPLNYAITKLRERFNHCENYVTTYGFIRHNARGNELRRINNTFFHVNFLRHLMTIIVDNEFTRLYAEMGRENCCFIITNLRDIQGLCTQKKE